MLYVFQDMNIYFSKKNNRKTLKKSIHLDLNICSIILLNKGEDL